MSLELFTDSENESDDIFTGLALSKKNSTNNGEEMKLFDTCDLNEYTEHSPFHDYEQIQFGKHGIIFYVEQGHEIEYLFYSKPCNRGVLGVTGKALESVGDRGTYNCTRHVKKCDGKDKFKDLKVMKSSVMITFHQKLNILAYIVIVDFLYPKHYESLQNILFSEKDKKVSKGLLTENDKQQESAMMIENLNNKKKTDVSDIPEEKCPRKEGLAKRMKRKWRRKKSLLDIY
ncbi:unnamed protein product [Mytilus coruscus]|uniref:Uncharacterized protein n=1 Tax=Mytilus coruscus TaxID=42192 RepID=A0A6J8B6W0_MYTCO|nr:unnamed protein product [Mytilus coruscus]